jgi:hypothetical protein
MTTSETLAIALGMHICRLATATLQLHVEAFMESEGPRMPDYLALPNQHVADMWKPSVTEACRSITIFGSFRLQS